MYRIKHSNKSSQTCIPSSFSIGVIKIMTKPITVVNPIQPRTRYSMVGLLTPRVRRRGRACIRPTVRVDWIFMRSFLKHLLSLLFLTENQWFSVIMILKSMKRNELLQKYENLPQKMYGSLFFGFPKWQLWKANV